MKLCFLDWDDTLLCTSYLRQILPDINHSISNLNELDQNIRFNLHKLSQNITFLLMLLKIWNYKVIIITNAEKKWVELSCEKYLPSAAKNILSYPIISACDKYSNKYSNVEEWKKHTFLDIYNNHIDNTSLNTLALKPERVELLVIGDSYLEKIALDSVIDTKHVIIPKFIKFITRPTVCDLVWEIDEICQQIINIALNPTGIIIRFEIKNNENSENNINTLNDISNTIKQTSNNVLAGIA